MASIFGTSGFFDSDKVQNQQAIHDYTNFTGVLAINGAPIGSTTDIQTDVDQVQSQAQGIAPAGQRDLWQYGTGGTGANGSYMTYSSDFGMIWTYNNTPGVANYSTDGGATFGACVFDVVPAGLIGIGASPTSVVALTDDGANAYVSGDGINFTSVAAPPAGLTSFSIHWFAAAGLFIAGATFNPTHTIITSPDGVVWTPQAATLDHPNVIKSNSTICVATCSIAPYVMSSPDGITWTNTTTPLAAAARALDWSPEQKIWMCTEVIGLVAYTSTNGLTWTSRGTLTPQLPGDSLIWVGNGINRWYGSVLDAAGNYSLVSSPSATTTFVGCYLDGALTNNLPYSLAYDAGLSRFYMGMNNSPYFAYSTARPLDIKALSDNIRVRGLAVESSLFSLAAPLSIAFSAAETSISTGTILGTRVIQDPTIVGSVINFKLYIYTLSAAGDTFTVRFKVNAGTVHTVIITAAAGVATWSELSGLLLISGGLTTFTTLSQSGLAPVVASTNGAYTPTITNTLDVTGQWGAAVNIGSFGSAQFGIKFRNGA